MCANCQPDMIHVADVAQCTEVLINISLVVILTIISQLRTDHQTHSAHRWSGDRPQCQGQADDNLETLAANIMVGMS